MKINKDKKNILLIKPRINACVHYAVFTRLFKTVRF
jgi:hypothetical protein